MFHATPTPRSVRPAKPSRSINFLAQSYKVLHQRVNIDVNLATNTIEGFTEITIIPTVPTLRYIRLDCREMEVLAVYVNQKPANFLHNDLLYINKMGDPNQHFQQDLDDEARPPRHHAVNIFDIYDDKMSLEQVQIVKAELGYVFGELNEDPREGFESFQQQFNTEELTVFLPENLKLELTELSAPAAGPNSLHFHTPAMGTPSRTKGTFSGDTYTPVTIKIEYKLTNPKNGVNFITHFQDRRKWHAYTTNSDFCVSTSSWVPCIDNLWERSTWTLEISIPRTVQDIGRIVVAKSRYNSDGTLKRGGNGVDLSEDTENVKTNANDDDNDEDDKNDLIVCTGDFSNVKEVPHPTDLTKKVVLWSIYNPICAHYVGWAVGNFESVTLPSFKEFDAREEDDDVEEGVYEQLEEKEASDTPFVAYCLPGERDLVINSVIFINKALEFFLREFGSFPFSLYAIAFVEDSLNKNSYDYSGLSLCSSRLLYNSDLIEPMIPSTEQFLDCLATQWSGINVVPQSFNEMWCTVGIAKYMSLQFIKVLMGSNEYRFRVKSRMNEIIETDVGRKPLGFLFYRSPILTNDLDFLKLKSPIILYILDKRMTKTDKSFGLSRVLPKIFLQAMSGDLPNGTLSTLHFQTVCEKVARHKLEPFFKQWVYGSGTPIFNITQKFNKKKMMIEMYIRQVQLKESRAQHPRMDTFLNDSIAYIEDEPVFGVQLAFTGPMTIRVHEADGVPYEHVIEIKEGAAKYDVQYNTKFRRMKKKEREEAMANGIEITGPLNIPTTGEAQPYERLGDVLSDPKDMEDWGFIDWPKRDEEEKEADAFEWIRVDADFEWIGRFYVQQPDYMYASQLQHDRDVEAQYDAIKYFGDREKPNITYCSMLARTAMDSRYYYGVRIAACQALADFSKADNNFIGLRFLMNIYKKLFCFPNSSVPLSNNFESLPTFYLQRALPNILCNIRDSEGKVSNSIKRLLINLVKFNDNSDNKFNDCFYISNLLSALTTSFLIPGGLSQIRDIESELKDPMLEEVITEIGRLQKLDEWIPSFQSVLLVACLRQRIRLAMYGLVLFLFEYFLIYTLKKHPTDIRIEAFRGLLILGGLKNASILRYFLKTLIIDSTTPYFRTGLIEVFKEVIGIAAVHGTPSTLDDPEFRTLEKLLDTNQGNAISVVVEDGAAKGDASFRRDAFARATISGAISILRRDYAVGKGLQEVLWELLHTSLLSMYEKRTVFTLCEVLYYTRDSFLLLIPIPSVPFDELKRKFVARVNKSDESLTILIKREGRNKIQLGGPRKVEEPVLSKLKSALKTVSNKQPGSEPASHSGPKLKVTIKKPSSEALLDSKVNKPSIQAVSKSSNQSLAKPSSHGITKPKIVKRNLVSRDARNKYLLTLSLSSLKMKTITKKRVSTTSRAANRDQTIPMPSGITKSASNASGSSLVTVKGTRVTFKLSKSTSEVRRFVKINLNKKKIYTSTRPFK